MRAPRGLRLRPRLSRGFSRGVEMGETMAKPPTGPARENPISDREKQTGPQVATAERSVYFSRHAAGETRWRARTQGTTWRKPHRDLGAGHLEPPGDRGRRGRSEDRTGILRDRRAVVRTASLRARNNFSETRRDGLRTVSDLRIAPRQRLRPLARLQSELGPRPDIDWARVPRGLRLRSRLPRGFLVSGSDGPGDRPIAASSLLPSAAGTLRSVACLHALPREVAQPG